MKLYHPINLTACGLAASIAVAWTRHPLGVLADGNPAGGGGERGGADGILAVAGDGDPWMDTGNDVVDFGLFNQDGGGHGGAIRGPGQFDGQAIHSDGGWGEVAFGSVGTNGDEGGEMVADIGTDAQAAADGDSGGVIDVMMSPHAYGAGDGVIDAAANGGLDISIEATTADEKDDGLVGNEVDAFVADDDGAFGSRTEDAKLSNKKARNDISIISIPEDGIKQLDQISRSLRGSGLEKVESSAVPKAAEDLDDGGSEDIARKNNVESSDAKKSGEDMAMTASSLDDAPIVVERNLGSTIIDSGWNPSHKLRNCEGDCDNDANCQDGLVCFQRDGGASAPPGCSGSMRSYMDYCWLPFRSGAIGSLSSGSMSDPAKMIDGRVATISGKGGDMWGQSDNFFFSSVTFNPYFTVEVFMEGFDPSLTHHSWAKCGLMVRDTLDPGSKHVSAHVSPTKVFAQYRQNIGGWTTHVDANSDPQGGVWLRIDRFGDEFQAFFKKKGASSYQRIWQGTINMSPYVQVGVALSSNEYDKSDSAQFSLFSPKRLSEGYFGSRYIDEIFFISTHNSLSLPGRVFNPNQNYGLKTQFNDGIRGFNFDLYWDGKIVTSHGWESYNYDPKEEIEELIEVLKANPLEFIVIQIENKMESEQRERDFVGWFGSKLIKNFDPNKRLGEYISLGQQILMVTDVGYPSPSTGWYGSIWYISENNYGYSAFDEDPDFGHRRGPKAPHSDRFMRNMNYFETPPSMPAGTILHDIEKTLSTIKKFESQSYFGGIANTILVDYYETGVENFSGLNSLQIVQYVMRNAGSGRFKEGQKCPYTFDAMCAGSVRCAKDQVDGEFICCNNVDRYTDIKYCYGMADGKKCKSDAMCSSGWCDGGGLFSTGRCKRKKKEGDRCLSEENDECHNGSCYRSTRYGDYKCCAAHRWCYPWTSGDCKAHFEFCTQYGL